MREITDKMDNISGDIGYLYANEYNAIKNELSNAIRNKQTMDPNDDKQLLRSIILESKMLYYKDNGTVNHIVLDRDEGVRYDLVDKQTFVFDPKFNNTGSTFLKIGNNDEKRVIANGTDLSAKYLDPKLTYLVIYEASLDVFNIKKIASGASSDYVFTNMHNESSFVEVTDSELDNDLYNNAFVYIDQNTNKYGLAKIENPRTQKQNVVGIFKIYDDKKYVFMDGIVPDFTGDLSNGFYYYLSDSTYGGYGRVNKTIKVGRYLKDNKFLLDIDGFVDVDVNTPTVRTFNTSIVDGETKENVSLTDTNKLFVMMFDAVTNNILNARLIMYANIENKVFKVDFPIEYMSNEFNIEYNGERYGGIFLENDNANNSIDLYKLGEIVADTKKPVFNLPDKVYNTIVGNPLTLETVTATDNRDGKLNVAISGTVDFDTVGLYNITYTATDSSGNSSKLTHIYNVEKVAAVVDYAINIKNPTSNNGITFTDPSNELTLMFNNIVYDQTLPASIMFIEADGLTAKIDYALEYNGKTFEVERNGIRYIGTFNENENYSSPTVIPAK